MKIRVAQFGVGPIGQACVRVLLQKPGVEFVGAIDSDPQKAGRDVGQVCGLRKPIGHEIRSDAEAALVEWRPQVVVHTTQSFLNRVEGQLASIVGAGAHVVSSTEELFYPFERDPGFCQRIDRLAREHRVGVVATGVNPGFAMDLLPLSLTSVCTNVKALKVWRVGDASNRRLPFQQKIGAGLTRAEFRAKLATGTFGHIGLLESAQTILSAFGWKAEAIKETIKPVIATRRVRTKFLTVEKGRVAGLQQTIRCKSGKRDLLVLNWQMSVGAKQPFDGVDIVGDPPISMRIDGGIFGDTGTIGSLVNAIPKIMKAEPGLRTMAELAVPHAFLGMPS